MDSPDVKLPLVFVEVPGLTQNVTMDRLSRGARKCIKVGSRSADQWKEAYNEEVEIFSRLPANKSEENDEVFLVGASCLDIFTIVERQDEPVEA